MSLNPFSDMDLKEMQQSYMGLKMPENFQEILQNATFYQAPLKQRSGLPTHVDWRDSGAITPVKDQKSCGSCWAFASVAALEAHYYLKYQQTVVLSEQNLVDCVTENWGCTGGWMVPSFQYVTINNGINPESVYPYEAVDGVCRHQYNKGPINKAYIAISPDNEEHLQLAVALNGPVAVAIQANNNFMNYKSGVFDDPDCSKIGNHAVLVVGYGTENGKDYWLIKNSWSSYWGDNGYIKMARNKNNQCAIARYASYPVF
ncbi:Cathepsin S [Lucilia cuprina]|nr:Cathepsin S [Lucilia cuprina]